MTMIATLVLTGALATASPVVADDAGVLVAQGADCYSIGQSVASQNGASEFSASEAVVNGKPVCRIIMVVPGGNGERPKRVEVTVPKN